ncbi:putative quinol monooxygenase [Williamsia sp.]|uniref:putative quinol monooxygenase n=1 Tax=Williamsia sp. TaxID=1872085 RepID=UPI002F94F188
MSLTALLELKFKEDSLDAAKTVMQRVLAETRAFDGCDGVEVLIDKADPTRFLAVERWATAEADAKYREWRAGDGAILDLGPLLAGRPNLTVYNVAADI